MWVWISGVRQTICMSFSTLPLPSCSGEGTQLASYSRAGCRQVNSAIPSHATVPILGLLADWKANWWCRSWELVHLSNLVQRVKEFLRLNFCQAVLCHHNNCNRCGYRKLSQLNILIFASYNRFLTVS